MSEPPSKAHVWIVEFRFKGERWQAISMAHSTRASARDSVSWYREEGHPDEHYRVRKYGRML